MCRTEVLYLGLLHDATIRRYSVATFSGSVCPFFVRRSHVVVATVVVVAMMLCIR